MKDREQIWLVVAIILAVPCSPATASPWAQGAEKPKRGPRSASLLRTSTCLI